MILLTGDKGFIGKHVASMLQREGIEYEGCDLVDGCDYGDIKNKKYDALIHCGAHVSVTESVENPEKYYSNNVDKFKKLITNNDFDRIIFLSTGGAMYGNNTLAQEDDPIESHGMSPYAISKLFGENMLKLYHYNGHIILRLANVHGTGEEDRKEKNVFTRFEEDDPIVVRGGVDTVRDFIWVTDVVKVIKRALESDIIGTFNIGSGLGTRIYDAARVIAAKRGVEIRFEPLKPGEVEYIILDITKAKEAGLL